MGFLFYSLFFSIVFSFLISNGVASNVTRDSRALLIDGNRRIIISGAIHYPRSTAQMWPDLIRRAKDGGLNTIETYVFWNAHEPRYREYDFTGNLDLIRFLKTIQFEGLYTILRIGPYACAEWNFGGLPVWLHNMPGCAFRTKNDVFMKEMQTFTTMIVDMVKKEKLFASQGGNIILAQIENEYGNVMDKYGEDGKAYINWCAKMADSLNVGVPWIMCQQAGAPKPMIETCNGFYCDQFKPKDKNTPKFWTENWTGWFKKWNDANPLRTAEDVAFAVARFFQNGGTLQNYYMYHGGTNFGRTSGGPFIVTSYDYDAPLNEYGISNQPKWGHLKQLHDVLHSMEYTLTNGDVKNTDLGNQVQATAYVTKEKSSCFLSNANETNDAVVNFGGINYFVPAWSVSVLPDCREEAYNTAKVYAQTSVYANKPNGAENEPSSLKWVWKPESIDSPLKEGKGDFSANKIIDQKSVTNDTSDYMWLMTSLDVGKDDALLAGDTLSLRFNNSGQIVHAFVNGEFIGSQWSHNGNGEYTFEKSIKLKPGKNLITLLSAIVGLANYGHEFDTWDTGVGSGAPVELVAVKGDTSTIKNLSAHTWSYKVGLDGITNKYYQSDISSTVNWTSDSLPVNKSFTWYKTNFNVPLGNSPIVLDLIGLGKGFAWVNGNNIGRYWPSAIATKMDACKPGCDYRGTYAASKCVNKCGEPSQRWYHVPRSFLKDGENTLVLFEELGGNPWKVQVQTVEIETACVNAYEGKRAELSCDQRPISKIKFASFGNPQGVCGSFKKSDCQSDMDALSILQKECAGKQSCSFVISEDKFGKASCFNKRLAVEATCS